MFHLRRVWGIAAVATTLTATALATSAADDAQAAGSAGSSRPGHTTLHVHVSGCDRCTVQLQQAVTGAEHVWQTGQQKVGGDHVATFTVATGFTHGMSFVVRAPWAENTDAVPNAVTAYAGHRLGSTVTGKAARHARRAAGCWHGTSLSDKSLHFRVARVVTTSASGQKVVTPLVYAPRTMSIWKPYVKTFHGAIGNQDAFYCTAPTTS